MADEEAINLERLVQPEDRPSTVDGQQQEGDQRRAGTCTLVWQYWKHFRERFGKNSQESFAHAWHKAAAPYTTASLLLDLTLSLVGCSVGIFILIGRSFHPEWDQALWFIGVHLFCGLAVILLAESDTIKPWYNRCEMLQKGVGWIVKWFCMSFYCWKIKGSVNNFFYKNQSKRKANEAFKDRATAYVAPSEIKTASVSRLIYVKESDLNRLEYSVRSFSLGALALYFHIYSTRCNSLVVLSRDAQTFGTLLWCLVMTSAAAMAFEQRYHEYAYIFHFYDRVYNRYSRVSMVEALLIFTIHFLRLVCKLHIIGYLLCLATGYAFIMTTFQLIWSFVCHHVLHYSGLCYLPALLHYKNFKRLLYVDHFVSSSPVTLLCSLGTKTYSHPEERETYTGPGSFLLYFKTLWGESLERLGIIFVKDLLPLLLSQTFLSVLATNMRPLESHSGFSVNSTNSTETTGPESLPGLAVNCTRTGEWDLEFLPDFAEPSSALYLFIPPASWRNVAAENAGDPLGFFYWSCTHSCFSFTLCMPGFG